MGALEFEPAIDVSFNQDLKFEIDRLVEVAKKALAEKSSFSVNIMPITIACSHYHYRPTVGLQSISSCRMFCFLDKLH